MEKLFVYINKYKKKTPSTSEERELVHNIFNCVASALLSARCVRAAVAQLDGVPLMLHCIRGKRTARRPALGLLAQLLNATAVASSSDTEEATGALHCFSFASILNKLLFFYFFS